MDRLHLFCLLAASDFDLGVEEPERERNETLPGLNLPKHIPLAVLDKGNNSDRV